MPLSMKQLTCQDIGGCCDAVVSGNTFEEMGEACKAHVMEALSKGDAAHMEATGKWRTASPEEQQSWMNEMRNKFDSAPDA